MSKFVPSVQGSDVLISNWENLNPMQALLPPRKVILYSHFNLSPQRIGEKLLTDVSILQES
jgi:hypothetical protein